MKLKGLFACVLLVFVTGGLGVAGIGSAAEQTQPFPTYGSGAVEVRLYTDYFCPPCRALEPVVEPLLKELLQNNAIRLTLVDTPYSRYSPLYASYFLYAIKVKNDLEHALLVRNTLFEAATNKHLTTNYRIEELFKEKRISYAIWEVKTVFERFNELIKEDKINATPSCVVIKNDQKKTFVGGAEIINALKALQ